MKQISDETIARLRDADLSKLEESIRVYEWLEAHKERPENPVFQFVFRKYYQIDNAGLTTEWKRQYFELLAQRESELGTILEVLYHIPTAKKVKSLQLSFATKLLHTRFPKPNLRFQRGRTAPLTSQTREGFRR